MNGLNLRHTLGICTEEKIASKETREKDNRELYGSEYVWKRNGPDHFCFIAGTNVYTEKGNQPIETITVGDRVLTRKGYKEVYHAGTTKRSNVYSRHISLMALC